MFNRDDLLDKFNGELERLSKYYGKLIDNYKKDDSKLDYIDYLLVISNKNIDNLALYIDNLGENNDTRKFNTLLRKILKKQASIDALKKETKHLVTLINENTNIKDNDRKLLIKFRDKLSDYCNEEEFRLDGCNIDEVLGYMKDINDYKLAFKETIIDEIDDIDDFNDFLDLCKLSDYEKTGILYLIYSDNAKRYYDNLNRKNYRVYYFSKEEYSKLKELLKNNSIDKLIDKKKLDIKSINNNYHEEKSNTNTDAYYTFKSIYGINDVEENTDVISNLSLDKQIYIVTRARDFLKKHFKELNKVSAKMRKKILEKIYSISDNYNDRDDYYDSLEENLDCNLAIEIENVLGSYNIDVENLSKYKLASYANDLEDLVTYIDSLDDSSSDCINLIYLKNKCRSYLEDDIEYDINKDNYRRVTNILNSIRRKNKAYEDLLFDELSKYDIRAREDDYVRVYYIPVGEDNAIIMHACLIDEGPSLKEVMDIVKKKFSYITKLTYDIVSKNDKYKELLKTNKKVEATIISTLLGNLVGEEEL